MQVLFDISITFLWFGEGVICDSLHYKLCSGGLSVLGSVLLSVVHQRAKHLQRVVRSRVMGSAPI